MIDIEPGAEIALSILFGMGIAPAVILFGNGLLRIPSTRNRFLAACAACFLAWAFAVACRLLLGAPFDWVGILCGTLILFTAVVAFGIIWSLVCWGFTSSLLAALCRSGSHLSRAQWFGIYGGGCTLDKFTDDRMSILLRLGLARVQGTAVALQRPGGRLMAAVLCAIRSCYGLRYE